MNYGKKGIRKKRKALHATSVKWGRKLTLFITKAILTGIISIVVIGASAGLGVFKGILSSATYHPVAFPPLSMIRKGMNWRNW